MAETKTKKTPNIYEKLLAVQCELKCKKSQYNSFGKYYYRSLEDILEGVKPLLKKHRLTLVCDSYAEALPAQASGGEYYVQTVFKATLVDLDAPER